MSLSSSFTIDKKLLNGGKVSLQWGNATITKRLQVPDETSLNLNQASDSVIVTTICDSSNFSFHRYILSVPKSPSVAVQDVIPNANISKLAVACSRENLQYVFIHNLFSTTPWSPENAVLVHGELKYIGWITLTEVAIITSEGITHWELRHRGRLVSDNGPEADGAKSVCKFSSEENCNQVLKYQVSSNGKLGLLETLKQDRQLYLVNISSRCLIPLENVDGGILVTGPSGLDIIAITNNNGQSQSFRRQLVICSLDSDAEIEKNVSLWKHTGQVITDVFPQQKLGSTTLQVCGSGKKLFICTSTQGYATFSLDTAFSTYLTLEKMECQDKKMLDLSVHPTTGKVMALAGSQKKYDIILTKLFDIDESQPKTDKQTQRYIPYSTYKGRASQRAATEAFFCHQNLSSHISFQSSTVSPSHFSREIFLDLFSCRMLNTLSSTVQIGQIQATKQTITCPDLHEAVPPKKNIVVTPNTEKNVQKILSAYMLNYPLVIQGCTAGGKTATVEYCAALTNSPLLRLNLTPQMTIADVVGSLGFKDVNAPHSPAKKKPRKLTRKLTRRQSTAAAEISLEFKPGIFTKAVKDGYWLLLDEANLASDEILRIIEDVFQTGMLQIQSGMLAGQPGFLDCSLQFRCHPNFRLLMAQNPPDDKGYAGTRNTFSVSLLSHFVPVKFPSIPLYPDTLDIIKVIIDSNYKEPKKRDNVAQRLMLLFEEAKQISRQNSVPISIRDVLQACGLLMKVSKTSDNLAIPNLMYLLFSQHMTSENQGKVKNLVNKFIGPVEIKKIATSNFPIKTTPLSIYGKLFELLDMSYATKRPGMIVGREFSGKTTSITTWAKMRNLKTETFYLSFETATEDLFGRILPDTSSASPFRWVDGPVIRAIKNGTCLILSGLNQPEDAVLESLNAVLESGHDGRKLHIANQTISVNPDFCIFATYSKTNTKDSVSLTPALLNRFLCIDTCGKLENTDVNNLIKTYLSDTSLTEPLLRIIRSLMIESKVFLGLGQLCLLFRVAQNLLKFCSGDEFLNHMKTLSRMLLFQSLNVVEMGKQGTLMPFPIEKQWFTDKGYFLSSSRHFLATVISMSIQLRIPLLLQGPAGVGKTSLAKLVGKYLGYGDKTIVFSCNKETTVNDLMGSFLPADEGAEFKDGPLCKAIEQGYVFIADELNIAPPEVIGFLTPLLSYPAEFLNPANSELLTVHESFSFIATQNPPEYAGRNVLPRSLETRFIKIGVPEYSFEEVAKILFTKVPMYKKISDSVPAEVENLFDRIQHLVQEMTVQTAKNEIGASLRHYLKVLRRLVVLGDLFKKDSWEDVINLHVECLYDSGNIPLVGEIQKDGNSWEFRVRLQHKNTFIHTRWTAESGSEIPSPVLPGEQLLLCKIALAFHCKEPIVIEGPTCFKTQALYHFSEMVQCDEKAGSILNMMYLSSLTDASDLLGRIEPHSPRSYVKTYAGNLAGLFHRQFGVDFGLDPPNQYGTVEHTTTYLECLWSHVSKNLIHDVELTDADLAAQLDNADYEQFLLIYPGMDFFSHKDDEYAKCKRANSLLLLQILQTLKAQMATGQGFPFCERGIMPQIRFGGIAVLKDLNMPDQATIESLNTVSDLESELTHPYDVEMPLEVNPTFFLSSTIREPAFKLVSPALKSRYSFLKVQAPDVLSEEIRLFMMSYLNLKSNLSDKDTFAAVNYLFGFIRMFKQCLPSAYAQITVHDLVKWARFANVKVASGVPYPIALKFSWATQLVFLDNIDGPQLPELLEMMKQLDLERQCIDSGFTEIHNTEPAADEEVFQTDKNTGEVFLRDAGILVQGTLEVFKEELIITPKTMFNMTRIMLSNYTNNTILMEGPPGVGKSKLPEVYSSMKGMGFLRISCSGNMSAEDLFGTFIPTVESKNLIFQFEEGVLTKAMQMKNGCVVLLDEINLASSEVLSTLIGVLKHPRDRPFQVQGQKYDLSQIQFICAQNPPGVGGGRKDLPHSLKCLLSTVKLQGMSDEEVAKIICQKYGNTFGSSETMEKVIETHFGLPRQFGNSAQYNLRDIQKLAALYQSLQSLEIHKHAHLQILAAVIVYAERFTENETKIAAQKYICAVYGVPGSDILNRCVRLHQIGTTFSVTSALYLNESMERGVAIPVAGWLSHSYKYSRRLEILHLAVCSKRIVNICGPSVSGKTSSVIELARMLNRKLLYLSINVDTEIADLVGGFAPVNPNEPDLKESQQLNKIVNEIMSLIDIDQMSVFLQACGQENMAALKRMALSNKDSTLQGRLKALVSILESFENNSRSALATSFQFFPGPVIQAMMNGDLLLLDNVDLAKPQVIERLNSLGEDKACLYSLEIGSDGGLHKYTPEPGFACICTTNTERQGAHQLSEAFRNRCIELHYDTMSNWDENELVEILNLVDPNHVICQPAEIRRSQAGLKIHDLLLSDNMSAIAGYKITFRNAKQLVENTHYVKNQYQAIQSAYGATQQQNLDIAKDLGRKDGTDAVYNPETPAKFQLLESSSVAGALFESSTGETKIFSYLLSLVADLEASKISSFESIVTLLGQILPVSNIAIGQENVITENENQLRLDLNVGVLPPVILQTIGLSSMLLLQTVTINLDTLSVIAEGIFEIDVIVQMKWFLHLTISGKTAIAGLEVSKVYPNERLTLEFACNKVMAPWKEKYWPLICSDLQPITFATLHVKGAFRSSSENFSIAVTMADSDEAKLLPGESLMGKNMMLQFHADTNGVKFSFSGDMHLSPTLAIPFCFNNDELESSGSFVQVMGLKEVINTCLRMVDIEKVPEEISVGGLEMIIQASTDGLQHVEVKLGLSKSTWKNLFGISQLELSEINGSILMGRDISAKAMLNANLQISQSAYLLKVQATLPSLNEQFCLLWSLDSETMSTLIGPLVKSCSFNFDGFDGSGSLKVCDIGILPDDVNEIKLEWKESELVLKPMISFRSGNCTIRSDYSVAEFSGMVSILGMTSTSFIATSFTFNEIKLDLSKVICQNTISNILHMILPCSISEKTNKIAWFSKNLSFEVSTKCFEITDESINIDVELKATDWIIVPSVLKLQNVFIMLEQIEELTFELSGEVELFSLQFPNLTLHLSQRRSDLKLKLESPREIALTMPDMIKKIMKVTLVPQFMLTKEKSGTIQTMTIDLDQKCLDFAVQYSDISINMKLFSIYLKDINVLVDGNYSERSLTVQMTSKIGIKGIEPSPCKAILQKEGSNLAVIFSASFERNLICFLLKKIVGKFLILDDTGHSTLVFEVVAGNEIKLQVNCTDLNFALLSFAKIRKATLNVELNSKMDVMQSRLAGIMELFDKCTVTFCTKELSSKVISFQLSPLQMSAAMGYLVQTFLEGRNLPLFELSQLHWFSASQNMTLTFETLAVYSPDADVEVVLTIVLGDWMVFPKIFKLQTLKAFFNKKQSKNWTMELIAKKSTLFGVTLPNVGMKLPNNQLIIQNLEHNVKIEGSFMSFCCESLNIAEVAHLPTLCFAAMESLEAHPASEHIKLQLSLQPVTLFEDVFRIQLTNIDCFMEWQANTTALMKLSGELQILQFPKVQFQGTITGELNEAVFTLHAETEQVNMQKLFSALASALGMPADLLKTPALGEVIAAKLFFDAVLKKSMQSFTIVLIVNQVKIPFTEVLYMEAVEFRFIYQRGPKINDHWKNSCIQGTLVLGEKKLPAFCIPFNTKKKQWTLSLPEALTEENMLTCSAGLQRNLNLSQIIAQAFRILLPDIGLAITSVKFLGIWKTFSSPDQLFFEMGLGQILVFEHPVHFALQDPVLQLSHISKSAKEDIPPDLLKKAMSSALCKFTALMGNPSGRQLQLKKCQMVLPFQKDQLWTVSIPQQQIYFGILDMISMWSVFTDVRSDIQAVDIPIDLVMKELFLEVAWNNQRQIRKLEFETLANIEPRIVLEPLFEFVGVVLQTVKHDEFYRTRVFIGVKLLGTTFALTINKKTSELELTNDTKRICRLLNSNQTKLNLGNLYKKLSPSVDDALEGVENLYVNAGTVAEDDTTRIVISKKAKELLIASRIFGIQVCMTAKKLEKIEIFFGAYYHAEVKWGKIWSGLEFLDQIWFLPRFSKIKLFAACSRNKTRTLQNLSKIESDIGVSFLPDDTKKTDLVPPLVALGATVTLPDEFPYSMLGIGNLELGNAILVVDKIKPMLKIPIENLQIGKLKLDSCAIELSKQQICFRLGVTIPLPMDFGCKKLHNAIFQGVLHVNPQEQVLQAGIELKGQSGTPAWPTPFGLKFVTLNWVKLGIEIANGSPSLDIGASGDIFGVTIKFRLTIGPELLPLGAYVGYENLSFQQIFKFLFDVNMPSWLNAILPQIHRSDVLILLPGTAMTDIDWPVADLVGHSSGRDDDSLVVQRITEVGPAMKFYMDAEWLGARAICWGGFSTGQRKFDLGVKLHDKINILSGLLVLSDYEGDGPPFAYIGANLMQGLSGFQLKMSARIQFCKVLDAKALVWLEDSKLTVKVGLYIFGITFEITFSFGLGTLYGRALVMNLKGFGLGNLIDGVKDACNKLLHAVEKHLDTALKGLEEKKRNSSGIAHAFWTFCSWVVSAAKAIVSGFRKTIDFIGRCISNLLKELCTIRKFLIEGGTTTHGEITMAAEIDAVLAGIEIQTGFCFTLRSGQDEKDADKVAHDRIAMEYTKKDADNNGGNGPMPGPGDGDSAQISNMVDKLNKIAKHMKDAHNDGRAPADADMSNLGDEPAENPQDSENPPDSNSSDDSKPPDQTTPPPTGDHLSPHDGEQPPPPPLEDIQPPPQPSEDGKPPPESPEEGQPPPPQPPEDGQPPPQSPEDEPLPHQSPENRQPPPQSPKEGQPPLQSPKAEQPQPPEDEQLPPQSPEDEQPQPPEDEQLPPQSLEDEQPQHPEDEQLPPQPPEDEQLPPQYPEDEQPPPQSPENEHPQPLKDEQQPPQSPEDEQPQPPEDEQLPPQSPEDEQPQHPEDEQLPPQPPEDEQLPPQHPEDEQPQPQSPEDEQPQPPEDEQPHLSEDKQPPPQSSEDKTPPQQSPGDEQPPPQTSEDKTPPPQSPEDEQPQSLEDEQPPPPEDKQPQSLEDEQQPPQSLKDEQPQPPEDGLPPPQFLENKKPTALLKEAQPLPPSSEDDNFENALPVFHGILEKSFKFEDKIVQDESVVQYEVEQILIPPVSKIEFPPVTPTNNEEEEKQIENVIPKDGSEKHDEKPAKTADENVPSSNFELPSQNILELPTKTMRLDKFIHGNMKSTLVEDEDNTKMFLESDSDTSDKESELSEEELDLEKKVPCAMEGITPGFSIQQTYSKLALEKKSSMPTIVKLLQKNLTGKCTRNHRLIIPYQKEVSGDKATILIDFSIIESVREMVLEIAQVLSSLNYRFQIVLSGDRLLGEPVVIKHGNETFNSMRFDGNNISDHAGKIQVNYPWKIALELANDSDVVLYFTTSLMKFPASFKQQLTDTVSAHPRYVGILLSEEVPDIGNLFGDNVSAEERQKIENQIQLISMSKATIDDWMEKVLLKPEANFEEVPVNQKRTPFWSTSYNPWTRGVPEGEINQQWFLDLIENIFENLEKRPAAIYGCSDTSIMPESAEENIMKLNQLLELAWKAKKKPSAKLGELHILWEGLVQKMSRKSDDIRAQFASIPANQWTRYSTSSKGKILSIKGLMNWFMTKGTSTEIWLTKNRGGHHQMSVCFVLALTSSMQASLPDVLLSMVSMAEAMEKMKLSTSCVAFNEDIYVIKDTDGSTWSSDNKAALLDAIGRSMIPVDTEKNWGAGVLKAMSTATKLLLEDGNIRATDPCYMVILTDHGPGFQLTGDIRSFSCLAEKAGIQCWAVGVGLAATTVQYFGVQRYIACPNPMNIDQAVHAIFSNQPGALEPPSWSDVYPCDGSELSEAQESGFNVKLPFTEPNFKIKITKEARKANPKEYLSLLMDYYSENDDIKTRKGTTVPDPGDFYCIRLGSSNFFLTMTGDNQQAVIQPFTGADNQQFVFKEVSPTVYNFRLKGNLRALDISATDSNRPLIEYGYHGGGNQIYKVNVVGKDEGLCTMTSIRHPDLLVDAMALEAGSKLFAKPAKSGSGALTQQWTFLRIDA